MRRFSDCAAVSGLTSAVRHMIAGDMSYAYQPHHVQRVHQALRDEGILKVSLLFPDDKSDYLRKLILGLSKSHGHGLPIDHSASRGWFWDIRPNASHFQGNNHRARSETMDEFPWHTDCSYEDTPPRYFALQVLQPDSRGGGALSLLNIKHIADHLSQSAKSILCRPEYRFTVPPEFVRSGTRRFVVGSVLAADEHRVPAMIRYREDIITPLSAESSAAFKELKEAVTCREAKRHTLYLTPETMPRGSILLVDNRRWLHARNTVNDPGRHLRRVRWDAATFG